MTINPINDNECFVTLLNYSDREIQPEFNLNGDWEIEEVIYGDVNSIPACDGAFLKITKN